MRLYVVQIILMVSFILTPGVFAQVVQKTAPLDILLTNDDGYDAPGIRAMHQALKAAGHRVTLVAPAQQQSGSSVRVTIRGKIGFEKKGDGVWAIAGSPADAVLVGFLHILAAILQKVAL